MSNASPAAADPIAEILRRIARVESEGQGGYAARGPVVTRGAYRGQRALGKYQVMPGNLAAWSMEALGREVTPEQFLANPAVQEAIARHRVEAYYQQYGNAADVASLWHSGRPVSESGAARDQNMTTHEYVRRVTGSAPAQDPGLEARLAAGRELRRRGALSPEQDAALSELERRVAAPAAEAQSAPTDDASVDALARFRLGTGGVAGAEGDTENTIRLRATYDASAPGEGPAADSVFAPIRAKLERGEILTPEEARLAGFESPEEAAREAEADRARARGAASLSPEDREGFNAAAIAQGFGSGLFGVGTPLSALGELISSRFDRDPESSSWGESLEFARGRRDELREEHPQEFYGGMAGSLLGGAAAVRGLAAVAPRAASVFTLRAGQTARNVARLSAAGAAAGGVTALNEEGTDAAGGGALAGAAAAPALAGGVRAGVGAARGVAARVSPDNAAIRLLARRLGEPVSALQQRYDDFVAVRGRPPRLAEIMRRETAEEMGQVSRVRPEAGDVFREAEEQAARELPTELSALVRDGRRVTSEPAVAARRAAVAGEAGEVVGRRVQSTEAAQVARRDVAMDRVMGRIARHRVPVTDEMLDVLTDPDVSRSLDPAVRRRVLAAIEAAGEDGTPYLSVARWDMIRQDLAARAGAGEGQIYARLRDRVRDYVSQAVPEYGAALSEFGRRSDVARGTVAGKTVLTRATREFVDMLRTAGGGTPSSPQRAAVRAAEQAGMRVGARTAIMEALGGDPAKAERFMERLAKDAGMRERVRLVLRDDEAAELTRLAARYGQQLDFSAGLRVGRSVLKQNDTDAFREAMATAGQVEQAGVRQGARAALSEAAGESPAGARRTAERLAEDPGLRSRIAFALGGPEQRRLTALGESATQSSRRLSEAVPGDASLAQARTAEQVDGIREVIRGAAVVSGRGGGGFVSAFINEIYQRVRIPRGAARRLAELATDPDKADQVIERLRRAGVSADEILRMYQGAAVAAGVMSGRE